MTHPSYDPTTFLLSNRCVPSDYCPSERCVPVVEIFIYSSMYTMHSLFFLAYLFYEYALPPPDTMLLRVSYSIHPLLFDLYKGRLILNCSIRWYQKLAHSPQSSTTIRIITSCYHSCCLPLLHFFYGQIKCFNTHSLA